MKQKIFAICDLEESYAFRMAEYISDKIPPSYKMHIFTRPEKLKNFLQSNEISVLLIAESAVSGLDMERGVSDIFILKESDEKLEKEYCCIDKFQSPEKIVSEMTKRLAGLEKWNGGKRVKKGSAKLIGVYSPVRRCLQTSFALTLGQLLAAENKALYLNFECYSGFSAMLHREFPADMMDMVYYFRCAKDKLAERLPGIVQNINGLDFVPPGLSCIDMQEISGEDWLGLLDAIEENGGYEYMILDLTEAMRGLFRLLERCYRIYTITKDDGFAMAKMKQYEQVLHLNGMEDIADKTVKCRFPLFKKLPSDLSLMTHGEFAGYVKAIIKEDLYGNQTG